MTQVGLGLLAPLLQIVPRAHSSRGPSFTTATTASPGVLRTLLRTRLKQLWLCQNPYVLVTTSKALVTSSDALVPSSFLLLLVVQLLPVRFGLVQMSNFTRLDPLLNVHINFLFVLVPFWSQEAGTGEPNHF